MDDATEKRYVQTLQRASDKIKQLTAEVATLRSAGAVAVVGIGCRFPGAADSPAAYWELLKSGRNAITEVPPERWSPADHYAADKGTRGKTYTARGGFVSQVDRFDAGFFGISPPEATAMDPQQRLLLEVSYQALEHAGIDPERLRGSRTGVFMGMSTRDYLTAHLESGDPARIDQFSMTGAAFSVAVGRLSYFYDLRGPSVAVDTACSSSLVAIHMALGSLRRRETDVVLVGGVNLMLTPEPFIGFSQLQALSPDGRCYSFDDRANGYVRGEGCGVIVLKRLADAQADGDRILAVLQGSAVNQDGESSGLTAPNALSQRDLIKEALSDSGLTAEAVDYIECHGTGTALGDPIEARALGMVFGSRTDKLLIGSVKSNIGHLESAAGIASVIKVILALQHEEIPGNLDFATPSRHIPWSKLLLEVVAAARPFPARNKSRIAGVSSFGFSGTNAHVILTSAPAAAKKDAEPGRGQEQPAVGSFQLLPLSAQSHAALTARVEQYRALLAQEPERFATLCQLAALGRKHFKHRLAVTAESGAEAVRGLAAIVQERAAAEAVYVPQAGDSNVVFMYSGQGSQYAGMAEVLYRSQPVFRSALDECAALVRSRGIDLLELLYGAKRDEDTLRQTRYAQTAIFAVEYALTLLLRAWGIRPAAVVGHSIGEYAAAWAAGVMSLADTLLLTSERGRLLQELPEAGSIVAVFATEAAVSAALSGLTSRVAVAAVNGPQEVVIAGGKSEVATVIARLEESGIVVKRLNASHAFHSPLVEPALAPFAKVLAGVTLKAPQLPFISTVTATELAAEQAASADYWCRQLRAPVRFADTVRGLQERGYRTLLEVGPHAVLTPLCRQNIGAEVVVIPTLVRGEDDGRRILAALGQLYVRGAAIHWAALHPQRRPADFDLPPYPFVRSKFWLDPVRHDRTGPARPLDTPSAALNLTDVSAPSALLRDRDVDKERAMAAPDQIHHRVRQDLAAMIQQIAGIEANQLDPETNLFRLGMTSIALTQLRQRIYQRYDLELSMSSFYQEMDTLQKLASHVAANLPDKARQALQETGGAPPAASVPAPAASERLPPTGTTTASSDAIKDIIDQQLRLMARQLDLLQGTASGKTVERPAMPAPAPAPAAAPSALLSTASPPAPEGRARHEKVDLRSMTLSEDLLTPRQAQFVTEFLAEYSRLTGKSKAMMAEHRPVFSDWINSLGFRRSLKEVIYPVVAHRSAGSRIWDLDGRPYIDMAIGYGVNYFGNKPDFVVKAVAEQLEQGFHLGPQFDLTAEVAEQIRTLTGVERVTFTNTGTEAVMTALRIARTMTGRDKIVIFAGSYHGTFDGILAQNRNGETQPAAPGTPRNMVRDVLVLEYGAERSLEIIAACANDLAAVLVEPVQSRNPSLQPKAFLQRLRAITAESKTALIFDEIITGFRLCPGGAQEYFGIRADLVTYGKVLGGGMPIGVIGGAARFMDAIDGGTWNFHDDSVPTKAVTFFGGTFCKHPLAIVAAHAVLKRIAAAGPELQREVNRRTARFVRAVNAFFETERVPLRARHCASFFRFESYGQYDEALQPITIDLLFYLLLAKGVYTWERRICFFSTAHTDADADYVLQAIQAAVAELRAAEFPFRDTSVLPPERQVRRLPLTAAQRGIYFLSQLPDGELAYHVTIAVRIAGKLSFGRLEQALQVLVDRHETLRTGFHTDAEGPQQEIHPRATITLTERHVDAADVARAVRESIRPFALAAPPLLRAELLRIDEQNHVLVIDAHHLIVDGIAFDVLVAELIASYQGLALEPVPAQYAAYVAWDRASAVSPKLASGRQYWIKRFANRAPQMALPTDFPRTRQQSFRGAVLHEQLDPALTARLRVVAKELDVTLFTVLLSAFYVLLHRLSGQDDIVLGTAVDHRSATNFTGTVGTFAKTLALRNRVAADLSFQKWVTQVQAQFLSDLDHQDFPFDALVDALGEKREMSRNPLFDVMFVFERAVRRELRTADLVYSQFDFDPAVTNFDLTLSFLDEGEALRFNLAYCAELFQERTVRTWARLFATLLGQLVASPTVPLGRIELLDAAERQRVTHTFNQTAAALPHETSIVALFERQAAARPHHVAVVHGETQCDYATLKAAADRLAHRLVHSHGVGATDVVVVTGHPGIGLVVALLAVAKTGAAFVPLDPSTPRERIDFIVSDTGAKVVLTDRADAAAPSGRRGTTVCWDNSEDVEPAGELPSQIKPEQTFYIIYTSGTTGRPKGVMIHNRGLVNYLSWFAQAFSVTAEDRFVLSSSFAYDMAHTNIWVALLQGGALHVLDEAERKSPQRFVAYLQKQRISCLKISPSFFHFLAGPSSGPQAPKLPALRLLVLGGEKINGADVARFLQQNPATQVVDEYGPTEITIACTAKSIDAQNVTAYLRRPSIGRPIHNTEIYILDRNGQPLPLGLSGEICVGGAGVATGYLNRPDLNQAAFVAYSHLPHARVYRTGDRGRFLPDGSIEFFGRLDEQIKLRGYRVEPAEIEQTLLRHSAVAAAAVLAVGEDEVSRTLAAFFVRRGSAAIELGAYLRAQLPEHMIPTHIIELAQLPLTANGKVDKAALQHVFTEQASTPVRSHKEPGDRETVLLNIWREVLGNSQLGRDDDFFAAGGDSIKALLIIARLRAEGFRLDLGQLFQHATLASLAEQVTRETMLDEQSLVTGELPLLPAQARWLHQQGEPRDRYCLAVVLTATVPLNARALDRALRHLQLHHDALRTRFVPDGSSLRAFIEGPEGIVGLETVKLYEGRNDSGSEEAAFQAAAARLPAGIDITRGPLIRATLFQLEREDRLLVVIHHLVVDGVSWRVLLEDLVSAYPQALAGQEIQLPAKTTSLKTWAQRVHEYAQSPALAGPADPLREPLGGAMSVAGTASSFLQRDRAASSGALDAASTALLVRGAHPVFGAGLQEVLLTALARAVQQQYGLTQIAIDLESHGRTPPLVAPFCEAASGERALDVGRTTGWFTAIFPVVVSLPSTDELSAQIRHVHATLASVPDGGFDHDIARYLGNDQKSPSGPEPARLGFNYLGRFDEILGRGPFVAVHEWTKHTLDPNLRHQYALQLEAQVIGDRLTWSFQYDAQTHTADEIEALASRFVKSLDAAVQCCAGQAGSAATDLVISATDWEALCAHGAPTRDHVTALYPLSPMQEGMLYSGSQNKDGTAYHEQFTMQLGGALDPERFARAWQLLSARHEVLRTVFAQKGIARPLQLVTDSGGAEFYFVDHSALSERERAARLREMKVADLGRAFDCARGPLLRVYLQRCAAADFRLIVSYHHILLDGWSMGVLVSELFKIYGALVRGVTPVLPPATPYRQYIEWLERQDWTAARRYWLETLADYERPARLPRKEQTLAAPDGESGALPMRALLFDLTAPTTERLKAAAAGYRVTLSCLLQTVWGVLLAHHNGVDDVVFGAVVSGRPAQLPGVLQMVGLFLNTMPLRVRMADCTTVAALASRVQRAMLNSEPYHGYALAEIQSLSPLRHALMDHVVVFENYPLSQELEQLPEYQELGLAVRGIEAWEQTDYDFHLEINPGARLAFKMNYNPRIFGSEQVTTWKVQLERLIERVGENPALTLVDLQELLRTGEARHEHERYLQQIMNIDDEIT